MSIFWAELCIFDCSSKFSDIKSACSIVLVFEQIRFILLPLKLPKTSATSLWPANAVVYPSFILSIFLYLRFCFLWFFLLHKIDSLNRNIQTHHGSFIENRFICQNIAIATTDYFSYHDGTHCLPICMYALHCFRGMSRPFTACSDQGYDLWDSECILYFIHTAIKSLKLDCLKIYNFTCIQPKSSRISFARFSWKSYLIFK